MRPSQIDIILKDEQKNYLIDLIKNGKKIAAIKEIRDMLNLSLLEARDYIVDLKEKMNKPDKRKVKKLGMQTYDELKDYLIKEKKIDLDDNNLWDILDLAFDTGLEEGENRGYKMRLAEERQEHGN